MAAAAPLLSETFEFQASQSWCESFKSKHKIRQRHVTKYVSSKEKRTFDELLRIAAEFQHQTSSVISNFDPDFVINTDQTGCEYRISSNRTLSFRGEKVTQVAVGQLNQLTHSYTAQYGLTLSGKLLPMVFICLQEPNSKFGPRVQQEVTQMMDKYKNVYITATKSGKLTKDTYNLFLDKVLKPYVKTEPFLFIIDSWGGQSDVSMYDGKFVDEDGMPTCSLKVIPPKCTPLCQPCDVYFYRQVKNYIRRLQNCPVLITLRREITSRRDAIKIHSLVHNQLRAPAFEKMIRYAWFAAKLSLDREVFNNVNDIVFPDDVHTQKCDCGKSAFARCSWCREYLCFECYYDRYHPDECTEYC
ncbi:uncharacterized protein LOC125500394 [Athalia rosae]|uniref:uncharacterized protein LOC125500394 n=1 Tax=Athalia rosae TaxID=37344 RepID=UPI002033F323|nr:uncharacterized protein LOC125500394 [Athalia rosae]